jgi:type III pantothenate kinase
MNCIVLDQGNTSLKWGLFINNSLVESGKIFDSRLSEELSQLKVKYSLPFLYSSVRSENEQTEFLDQFPFCEIISIKKFPTSLYTSGNAGKDRLANIAGATKIYGENDVLVVDFGTCITYSVGKKNQLFSGVISLGVQSRLRAMHEYTGQLPLLELKETAGAFQHSTETSMMSSVNFGIVSEIEGYINAAISEIPDIAVVFTGTDASHFAKQLNYRIFVELNLTLIGLYAISCANES